MVSFTHAGANYRTKLMTADAAARFARCLSGNGRFAHVAVVESPLAKGEKRHFIAYRPASEARQAELLQDAQDERLVRAALQGHRYEFVLDESGRYFHCLSLASGEVYQTTEHGCDCPDSTYRCQGAGIVCKHVHALREGFSPVRNW